MTGYKPLDFFSLFFTMELWQMISDHTNQYTRKIIEKASPLSPRSIWQGWVATTAEEMKVFHAVLLYMAIIRKTVTGDFFSTTPIRSVNHALNCFSKTRFHQIFWGLHVGRDEPTANQYATRRSKVGDVVDYLHERF